MKYLLTLISLLIFVSISQSQTFPEVTELPDEPNTAIRQTKPYSAPVDFFFNHKRFTNTDDTINHVFNWGINVTPSGGPAVSGWPATYLQMESNYVAVSGQRVSEIHFDFDGHRPFHSEYNHSTGAISTQIRADNLNFIDGFGTVNFQMYAGKLIFQNDVGIRSINNNTNILTQFNATSTGEISLIKADATNTVVLGNGTFNARTGPLTVKDSLTFNDLKLVRDDAHTLRLVDSAGVRGILDISELKINGQTVLIAPCDAIADGDGTLADTARAVNELIDCWRHNKLIASP
jgi:hypothetical protein